MFAFITIGTNNLKQSSQFYDELLKILSIVKVIEDERYVGYSYEDNLGIIEFYIMCPFDKKEATIGNGKMISFDAKTPEKVNEFHHKALNIGATNEGFPGPRHGEDYYAYIRILMAIKSVYLLQPKLFINNFVFILEFKLFV